MHTFHLDQINAINQKGRDLTSHVVKLSFLEPPQLVKATSNANTTYLPTYLPTYVIPVLVAAVQ